MDIQAFNRAMLFLDAYYNDTLPEDMVMDFRTWLVAKYNSEEKIEAMYRFWIKGIKLGKDVDPQAMKSFDEVARKLNFPKHFEEEFVKMRKDIPLVQMREELLPFDIEQTTTSERHTAPKRKGLVLSFGRTVLTRVAAAVALICITGAAYYFIVNLRGIEPQQVAMTRMVVPDTLGAQGRIELPDGTDVFVRPGSALSYAEDFNDEKKRHVVLESGEVYLDVAKDSTKQFVVETSDLTVNVLGTKFDVKRSPDKVQTLVTLYEGRVEVQGLTGKDGHTVVSIAPGQRLVYNNATGQYKIEQVAASIPDWIAQRLTFRATPLGEVFRTIEWYWGVKIVTDNRLDLTRAYNLRFRGREDINTAMTVVENVMLNFTFTMEGNTVRVTAKNNN